MKQIVKIDPDRCKSCGLCVDACPRHYLKFGQSRNQAGHIFVTPEEEEDCVGCGTCVLVCPEPLALTLVDAVCAVPPTPSAPQETNTPQDAEDIQTLAATLSAQAVDSITQKLIQKVTHNLAESVTNEIIRKLKAGELQGMMQAAEQTMRASTHTQRAFLKGNDAVVCAALAAGCRAFFGYPITPASEIAHDAMAMIPKAGGIAIQAESEVSAINMLYGAAAVGSRAMTATSGPGFSLMQEGISYMASARLPGVIVNVMRAGPGLGNIGPEQGDYFMATRGGGHGHYHTPVLAPANVSEMFSLTYQAFDIAFQYRTPVIVLADAFIGQVMETIDLPNPLPPIATAAPDWAVQPTHVLKIAKYFLQRALF
ncbi:MAG: 4Fe-4S binding protein, partial [Proteobacteria bacterium]|nr:4Fe-4S binding protein [Pseudomonadota bacterium]